MNAGQNADSLTPLFNTDPANTVTSIYEACSFQDIIRQCITKVVKILKHIETKVLEIINVFGHNGKAVASKLTDNDEKDFMHCPQIGEHAASQEEIDK